jgi:hypothetical protein
MGSVVFEHSRPPGRSRRAPGVRVSRKGFILGPCRSSGLPGALAREPRRDGRAGAKHGSEASLRGSSKEVRVFGLHRNPGKC